MAFGGGQQLFVDIGKIEKFTMAMLNLLKNDKPMEFVLQFLE